MKLFMKLIELYEKFYFQLKKGIQFYLKNYILKNFYSSKKPFLKT